MKDGTKITIMSGILIKDKDTQEILLQQSDNKKQSSKDVSFMRAKCSTCDEYSCNLYPHPERLGWYTLVCEKCGNSHERHMFPALWTPEYGFLKKVITNE